MSALIRDGKTRAILRDFNANFLFPEYEFQELINHKNEIINKAGFSEREFYILILRLIKHVKIIPADLVRRFCIEAYEIIGAIDKDDVFFIATALAFNCPVWSDDKHFLKQNKIRILTTKDVINLK